MGTSRLVSGLRIVTLEKAPRLECGDGRSDPMYRHIVEYQGGRVQQEGRKIRRSLYFRIHLPDEFKAVMRDRRRLHPGVGAYAFSLRAHSACCLVTLVRLP
jgi:hypothetical protein